MGAFLEWWLDVQEAKVGTGQGDLSLNTWLNFKWALGPVIETLGKYRLAELEPEHVEGLLAKLAREGKARGSVTRVRTVLGQALEVAMRRGKVSRNVAKLSEMPKTAPPPEKRALTVEQAEALLEAAQGDPVECFIIVGLTTGLRPGELLGLRWDDVDLDAATLEVTGSLKREGSTLRLGGVKGGLRRARRRLDLTARAVEALRSHRGAQRQLRLLVGPDWEDLGFVFPTEVGTPAHPSGMNRKLARVTERAGLGHWSMTELARHSAASLLSDAGVPLEQIADQLGHSSTRMLEKHYRHQVKPSIDVAVPVMEELFGVGDRS